MATFISDDFVRADDPTLGAAWSEFGEAAAPGVGIQLKNYLAHCQRTVVPGDDYGYAIYKTILNGTGIRITHTIQFGNASGYPTNERAHTHWRCQSTANADDCYFADIYPEGLDLYRTVGGANSYIASAVFSLGTTQHEIQIDCDTITGGVHNVIKVDGAVVLDNTDTNAARITADGYAGFYMKTSAASASNTIDVGKFAAAEKVNSIADNFNRADDASLGANWYEENESHYGIQIKTNKARCEYSGGWSGGWVAYKAVQYGTLNRLSANIQWNSTDNGTYIVLKLKQGSTRQYGYANDYHFYFDRTCCKIRRQNNGGQYYLATGAAVNFSTVKAVTVYAMDCPYHVHLAIYVAGVLILAYDDGSALQISGDGYVGIEMLANANGDWITLDDLSCDAAAPALWIQPSRVYKTPPPPLHKKPFVYRPDPSRSFFDAALRKKYYFDMRGRFRIFNYPEYRIYRTNGSPPLESDVPWQTSASLPVTPAVAFADGTWYLSMSYFNGCIDSGFLPLGPLGETYKYFQISAGVALTDPPQNPLGVSLQVISGGVIRVVAYYLPSIDGVNAATEWAIAYTNTGMAPSPNAPNYTPAMSSSGLAVLQYDLPAQPDSTIVKVMVQTRRALGGGSYRYSAPNTVYSATADAVGPTVPVAGDTWRGALPEDA